MEGVVFSESDMVGWRRWPGVPEGVVAGLLLGVEDMLNMKYESVSIE